MSNSEKDNRNNKDHDRGGGDKTYGSGAALHSALARDGFGTASPKDTVKKWLSKGNDRQS